MKKLIVLKLFFAATFLLFGNSGHAQNPINWTEKQLMAPSELSALISSQKDIPVIISIGPGAVIPNSIPVGMINTKEGLDKLKTQLSGVAKDRNIVIYCGCCPYEHCPNVRPGIDVLKELKFTNYYLLNLPNNIKKDWIDKGYPVAKS